MGGMLFKHLKHRRKTMPVNGNQKGLFRHRMSRNGLFCKRRLKMRVYPDLIGKRFGKLTVVEQLPSTQSGHRRWLCKCDCGGEHIATSNNLNRGRTTNCGCKKSPDLTGRVFGRLTVIGRSDKRNPRGARTTPMWECRCECGNIAYKATDTLTNSDESMCQDCHNRLASEKARASAGFVEGTQISKIKDMTPSAANTSGYRGVYYVPKFDQWRAQIIFKRKRYYLGTFKKKEDAIKARQRAEEELFGTFLEKIGTAD